MMKEKAERVEYAKKKQRESGFGLRAQEKKKTESEEQCFECDVQEEDL